MIQTYIGNKQPNVFTADPLKQAIAFGRANDDILHGSGLDDYLFGNRGADLQFGNEGNDFLSGGRGADRLYGGDGDDILKGGRGKDSFEFRIGEKGVDTVLDFKPGRDSLVFSIINPGDPAPNLNYDPDTGFVYNNGNPVVWIGKHDDFDLGL